MAIKIIPAQENGGNSGKARRTQTRRVAAYCRVSTDLEEQESSYEAQCIHYREYIENHPDWCLAGIYADEGISGTGTAKRTEFKRMIQDCESGMIDLVITKSISRFARNTLDCLKYIRKLKAKNIPIIFEKESVNTMEAEGEVLITILASLAQQESASISRNVEMGIRYKFQRGIPMVNHNQFLGFTKDENGRLIIVAEQAQVVRRIYRAYLDGDSPGQIARDLEADGVLTGCGKKKWHESTVRGILRNEKYMGDLLLQKYYTEDFLTKRIRKNMGVLPQYYVENDHAPIVPREIFQQVQGEFERRKAYTKRTGKAVCRGSRTALEGRLICGCCGVSYRCYTGGDGKRDWRHRYWEQRKNTCCMRIIEETDVKSAVLLTLNRLPERKEEWIARKKDLRENRIRRIDERLKQIETEEKEQQKEQGTQKLTGKENNCRKTEGMELQTQEWEAETEKKTLLVKRAEYAAQEMQIRAVLELIEGIEGKPARDLYTAETSLPESRIRILSVSGACQDPEDFFRRTCTTDQKGMITEFADRQVIKYVKCIRVLPEGYEVELKADSKES